MRFYPDEKRLLTPKNRRTGRRALALLLLFSLILPMLAACRQEEPLQEPDLPAAELAAAVAASTEDLPASPTRMDSGDPDALAAYALAAYGLSQEEWTDCAAVLAMGARAYEIAVLRFADEEAAAHGEECLRNYLTVREGTFFGYVPEQAALVSQAVIRRIGTYVGLFICEEPEAAGEVFASFLEAGKLPELTQPTQPEEPEIPAVDMRALMAELMDACRAELEALEDLSILSSFDAFGNADPSAPFFAQINADYGIDGVESGFCVRGDGEPSALELTVLYMADGDSAAQGAEALRRYLADTGAAGQTVRLGRYLALFICRDPAATEALFRAALEALSSEQPSEDPAGEPPADMELLAGALTEACRDELEDLGNYTVNTEGFGSVYGLDPGQVEGSLIIRPWETEKYAFEIAVFCMKSQEDAVHGAPGLRLYLWSRARDYREAALPDQAALAGSGIVVREGRYLALLISQNGEALRDALPSALEQARNGGSQPSQPEDWPVFLDAGGSLPSGEPDPDYPDRIRFRQPGEEDMTIFDNAGILDAWRTGDRSALSEDEEEILAAAVAVMNQVLEPGMDDFHKEAAIYDWIVSHVDYGYGAMDVLGQVGRDAYTPYGGLIDHEAVCLGFSTTFQLFMDLTGIECITVVGAAFGSAEDHAWNMVRLNGAWYCVDATWDISTRGGWAYFNVTSDYMARTNHQWDYAAVPEAVTEGHGKP